MHFAGTLTLFDIALNTWDRAAVIYPLCAISSVVWNMVHYDRKDSAAIAKAMGGFESNDPALRDMVGAVHARSGLGGEVPNRDGARGPTLHRVRAEIPCVGPYVPYVGSV